MGKKSKKRRLADEKKALGQPANAAPAAKGPKSMVIRIGAGEVGPSVSQLALDVRSMMEPGTASRLKERKANRLRDYTAMAGPLGVTHLLLFSRSSSGNTNMRIALAPRGPTLNFRVDRYSLCKDVRRSMKRPQVGGKEYQNAPLLVMNNFMSPENMRQNQKTQTNSNGVKAAVPKNVESLATTVFQSLFPPIAPQTTPLSSIRRVLLLDREMTTPAETSGEGGNSPTENASYIINLRHYAITTKRVGLSRTMKRFNAAERLINGTSKSSRKGGIIPKLDKLGDIADYVLDQSATGGGSGFTSGSDSEAETDAEVEVLERAPHRVLSRKKLEELQARAQEDREEEVEGYRLADGASEASAATTSRPRVEKRAIKLVEIGPRMRLRLTKIEEGLCQGKTMWHEYVSKTREEVNELDSRWQQRRKEKEERKKIQSENVARKKREKGEASADSKAKNRDGEMEDEDMEYYDSEDF